MRAYLRRWAPLWTHSVLTGLALGLTIGVSIRAVQDAYVPPVWIVVLAAALRHLHATGGARILITTGRKALGKHPAADEQREVGSGWTCGGD